MVKVLYMKQDNTNEDKKLLDFSRKCEFETIRVETRSRDIQNKWAF